MAARVKRIRNDDEIRNRIRVGLLTNRLQASALGDLELSPSQIKCTEILLRKCLPDLQTIEYKGDANAPIRHVFSWSSPPAFGEQTIEHKPALKIVDSAVALRDEQLRGVKQGFTHDDADQLDAFPVISQRDDESNKD